MTTFRPTADLAHDLIAGAFEDGGTTVNPVVGVPVPRTGYVVGTETGYAWFETERVLPSVLAERVEAWVDAHARRASFDHHLLGSWFDSGAIWVDIVEVVSSERKAVRLARQRNEIAVFDLVAQRDVHVGAPSYLAPSAA